MSGATIGGSDPARRYRLRYDVSHVVAEPGEWFISAELVMPAAEPIGSMTVLCCTPGGGCTGGYFDLGGAHSEFSFAEYACAAGFACVLVDNLATGESTPDGERWISPQSVARANAEAFRLAVDDVQRKVGVPAHSVGVGHSMGAMLTLIAQADTGSHIAIACLGFTPTGLPEVLSAEELEMAGTGAVTPETLTRLARQRFSDTGRPTGKQEARPAFPFSLPGTDRAALQALAATATNLLPLPATLSLLPGNVVESIRKITVPVFLGGGDHEPWHRPDTVVPCFEHSQDISFYTLVDAAHNHNVAPTRKLLWERMLGWAGLITKGKSCDEAGTTTEKRRMFDKSGHRAHAEG